MRQYVNNLECLLPRCTTEAKNSSNTRVHKNVKKWGKNKYICLSSLQECSRNEKYQRPQAREGNPLLADTYRSIDLLNAGGEVEKKLWKGLQLSIISICSEYHSIEYRIYSFSQRSRMNEYYGTWVGENEEFIYNSTSSNVCFAFYWWN